MNFNRIQSLLRYDWTLQKRTISLAFIITLALYICLIFLFFVFKGAFDFDIQGDNHLPVAAILFCNSYFNYAMVAMMIVVTQVLHEKFTAPRTSLSYLTLPGTNAEKCLVMVLDYAIVALALWVMQIVMYDVTMLIGYCLAPDLHWIFNPFSFFFTLNTNRWMEIFTAGTTAGIAGNSAGDELGREMIAKMMDKILWPAMTMTIFVNLFQLAVYMVVNMCFRTHGQLKSIACLLGFSAVMVIVTLCMSASYFINYSGDVSPAILTNWVVGDGFSVANCIRWYYYSTPFLCAALLYLFYKQICWKQAK